MRRRLIEGGGEETEASLASTLNRLADVYEQAGDEEQAAATRAEARALESEEEDA